MRCCRCVRKAWRAPKVKNRRSYCLKRSLTAYASASPGAATASTPPSRYFAAAQSGSAVFVVC